MLGGSVASLECDATNQPESERDETARSRQHKARMGMGMGYVERICLQGHVLSASARTKTTPARLGPRIGQGYLVCP